MTYEYVDPRTQGWRRVRLSRADHNRIFSKRQVRWFNRYEYFMKDGEFLMHRFITWPAVGLSLLVFPVMLLVHGVANRDLWREYADLMRQKKTGNFVFEGFRLLPHAAVAQELTKAVKP